MRDPHTGDLVFKSVFIVFYSGHRSQDKVAKICDAFGANRYNYPSNFATRTSLLSEVQTRIDDLQHVIETSTLHRREKLDALSMRIGAWRTFLMKRKAVYRTLNMWNYDITRKCLIAEGWCPVSLFDETQRAARAGAAASGAQVPSIVNIIDTDDTPPTYFKLNKFTAAFQGIVDGYGIPRYGEINPAAFTIITYPFLFGVMFGDVRPGRPHSPSPSSTPSLLQALHHPHPAPAHPHTASGRSRRGSYPLPCLNIYRSHSSHRPCLPPPLH